MKTPKLLSAVPEPVKLIFVGGFLGAGKTTALGSLAKMLIGSGKKLGIVTNDQSGDSKSPPNRIWGPKYRNCNASVRPIPIRHI